MTSLKDTLEANTPVAESAAAQAGERTKSDSGHLRSDAVSLDVPVKVHGSRVTDVVRGITPHTEPFEEQASTMIVFPQGGVLRMSTPVAAGQMVVLTNLKTGHDAICRVVKVRACAQNQSYVELEFTNRQPGYWGVHFLTDEIDPVKPFAPPPPPPPVATAAPESRLETKPAPQSSWTSPAAQAPPVRPSSAHPSKQESSFVGIGSQEEVQPAASSTGTKHPTQRAVAPPTPLSMAELRGDAHAAPPVHASLGAGVPGEMTATDVSDDLAESSQESAQEESPAVAFGRMAASASLSGAHAAPHRAFGARFDSSALGVSDHDADVPKESSQNKFFIGAGIAAMLVVGAVGAFYFHVLPGGKSAPKSVAISTPAPSVDSSSPASPAPMSASQTPASNPPVQVNQQPNSTAPLAAPAASPAVVTTRTVDTTPERPGQVPAHVQSAPLVNQKSSNRVADMSAALTAHPVSSQRSVSGESEAAPTVDASGGPSNGELQGIAANPAIAPPKPAEAPSPIKVGGDVKPPALLSSALPIYPEIARETGIEGSVVIEASVDPTGKVVGTKVVSGPAMLRQAATDALRRWKYSPATLNGQPVAVTISVTIMFHR